MATETMQQELERIATDFDVEADAIRVRYEHWQQYMREGVLVQLHLGRWRARKTLTAKDLGLHLWSEELSKSDIKRIEAVEKMLRLGQMYLLPKPQVDRADAIERKARYTLEKWTLASHWGRFATAESYRHLKQELTRLEDEYQAWADEVYENWDALVQETSQEYVRIAGTTYKRLQQQYPELMTGTDVRQFIRGYVRRVMAHLVDKEEFKRSIYFQTELSYIPLPHILAEERAQAAAFQEQAATAAAEADARRRLIRERERLEQEKLHIERQKVVAELRAVEEAAAARERLLKEMHADVLDQARRQQTKLVRDFFTGIQEQLLGQVYEVCQDVLAYMKRKNGKLSPRQGAQIRLMIESVKALNLTGIPELQAATERMDAFIEQPVARRDNQAFADIVENIAVVMRQELYSLGQEPRQNREAGLPEVAEITPAELNRRRRNLGLAVAEDGDPGAAAEVTSLTRRQREWAESVAPTSSVLRDIQPR